MYCTRQLQAKIEKGKSFQWINTTASLSPTKRLHSFM